MLDFAGYKKIYEKIDRDHYYVVFQVLSDGSLALYEILRERAQAVLRERGLPNMVVYRVKGDPGIPDMSDAEVVKVFGTKYTFEEAGL